MKIKQIELFWEDNHSKVKNHANDWIRKHPNFEIIDIQMSTCVDNDSLWCSIKITYIKEISEEDLHENNLKLDQIKIVAKKFIPKIYSDEENKKIEEGRQNFIKLMKEHGFIDESII